MACSFGAFAQTELKEPTGTNDVAIAVKQLTRDTAQAQPVGQDSAPNSLPVRIFPFGRGEAIRFLLTNTAPVPGAHLTYWGGPVIANIQVVVVFWCVEACQSVIRLARLRIT